MGFRKTSHLFATLASVASVAAHGHVKNIIVNGVSYRNYIPVQDPYSSNPPLVAGWAADQRDNGYVDPTAYGEPNIICHRSAVSSKARITVAAGDTIHLQWTEWPDSHKGPVMDFLANCNGPCDAIRKEDLRFFKIDGAGLINPPQQTNRWAASVLIDNGNAWLVRIPPNIAPGHYVLRHDIIALHSANQPNGAQSYPQCINLEITGQGTDNPPGIPGTALYNSNDPGILYNIYRDRLNDYVVPGPSIISGGVSMLSQSRLTFTSEGSATPYSTTYASSSARATSNAAVSSSKVVVSSSDPVEPTSRVTDGNNPSASIDVPPKTPTPTTLRTVTDSPPATTNPPSPAQVTQALYAQCGGRGYNGPTLCLPYATCSFVNEWYKQCVLAPANGGLPLYSQCGGHGYTGPTECVTGARCHVVNPYYSQCLP
ncbi:glycoside hydrolase family 61 protein [Colletotrichum truncatum]|uniref:Glycoside hydrolase family 61 protein n=1 Tax=Colletotrichum truncatum TaxID=5467 RepID=A0ACC3ZGZ0_COLTU|nr:glycoside hydrolase family 61 protein [Colletotrichum truncatum]KAF6784711.1 glycoside hydrolase family 61 protein [Colletotrichum truncatum]